MRKKHSAKWIGEFLVIVVGVLVALAVDDWVQDRSDRKLEVHLLERLAEDLVADAADLAIAQVQVARRQWLFDTVASALAGVTPSLPPDSLVAMEKHAALIDAAGRSDGADFVRSWIKPLEMPLMVLNGIPDFDVSDGSYQEILATGALRALKSRTLRSAIVTYYWTVTDMRANVVDTERHVRDFRENLRQMGVSITDELSMDELVEIVREEPYLGAQARDVMLGLADQALFLEQIEQARLALEKSLAASST
jgi:hypothetical protein